MAAPNFCSRGSSRHPPDRLSEPYVHMRIGCKSSVPFCYISKKPRPIVASAGVAETVANVAPTAFPGGVVAPAAPTTLSAVALNPPAMTSFEPQLPDGGVLAAQGLVLVLTITAAGYWWLVVVPSERAALGRSKRMGALNTYLDELERPEAERGRWLERWFYTDWLREREQRRHRRQQQPTAAASIETAATTGSAAGAAKDVPQGDDPYDNTQPDDPNLLRPAASTPTPRFISLDNPIVATGALLLLAAFASGLQPH